jgi:uncharacterized membrane protein YhaH (DUF805 family)
MFKLLGINGRIGRGTWWLVQIATMVFGITMSYVFGPSFDLTKADIEHLKTDPAKLIQFFNSLSAALPYYLLTGLVNHWLFCCSSVQRLHDRGSAGWRVVFTYVPIFICFFSLYSLIAHQSVGAFLIGGGLFLVGTLVSGIWLIIECGMLPGDDADNDYGPMPGGERRKAALGAEISSLAATSSGRLANLDDDYIANYAKKMAQQQATQQSVVTSAPSQNFSARPAFGKR